MTDAAAKTRHIGTASKYFEETDRGHLPFDLLPTVPPAC